MDEHLITALDCGGHTTLTYDLNHPEDILIRVEWDDRPGQNAWASASMSIYETSIQSKDGDPEGAASYALNEVGMLDCTLEDLLDPPSVTGFFVVEGVTATYYRGDGWRDDDDMAFEYDQIRPATVEEIVAYFGVNFWVHDFASDYWKSRSVA